MAFPRPEKKLPGIQVRREQGNGPMGDVGKQEHHEDEKKDEGNDYQPMDQPAFQPKVHVLDSHQPRHEKGEAENNPVALGRGEVDLADPHGKQDEDDKQAEDEAVIRGTSFGKHENPLGPGLHPRVE